MPRRRLVRRVLTVAVATSIAFSVAACDQIFAGAGGSQPTATVTVTAGAASTSTATATPKPTATCDNYVFQSVFSAYGSLHYSVVLAPKLTLYLDMYTSQKTHDWFPATKKQLGYTISIFDTHVPSRAKFVHKRRVYMSTITVEAVTKKADGSDGALAYALENEDPRKITLDPEALQDDTYGLLVTSPKGGLNIPSITLHAMDASTVGFNMQFSFVLSIETKAGSKHYNTHPYSITIPVAVFTPKTATASTSCATSSTLAPAHAAQ